MLLNIAHICAILCGNISVLSYRERFGIIMWNEYEKILYKQAVIQEVYESQKFRRAVLGAVIIAADECGYKRTKKLDLVHWASEALANKTIEELDSCYMEYARNGFK